jgi:hypothetical protein
MIPRPTRYLHQIVSRAYKDDDGIRVLEMPLDRALEAPDQQTPPSTEPPHPAAECGEARPWNLEVDVSPGSGHPAMCIAAALAHRQGMFSTDGTTIVPLDDASSFRRLDSAASVALSPADVHGGELDPAKVSEAAEAAGHNARGAARKPVLQAFLYSRHCSGFSGDGWAELVQKARAIMAAEAAVRERAIATGGDPPAIMVRDRTGGCTIK